MLINRPAFRHVTWREGAHRDDPGETSTWPASQLHDPLAAIWLSAWARGCYAPSAFPEKETAMRQLVAWCAALSIAVIMAAPAAAQVPVNVTQDCWTNRPGTPPEIETYCFAPQTPVTFIWKQKLMLTCSSYRAEVWIQPCANGKPPLQNPVQVCKMGPFGIPPNPNMKERLVRCLSQPGAIPPGVWDWFVMTECNDTNGGIGLGPDGDIDDECGINAGFALGGPLVLGPEPAELWDADPGVPPCR